MIMGMVTDILQELKSLKTDIVQHGKQANINKTQSIIEQLKLPAKSIEELIEIENFLSVQDNFIQTVKVFQNVLFHNFNNPLL